ncbi:hypothetical protein [Microscilla marina]|uniref:Uncharacterized protein n=1 Tax=Microscilla marina ATCC 23134 TaxID=313606 RepID=A1ZVH7_MICM2|nr:hypothetical protein [Microscilla marina]EAY25675.1 hypothetical protein M23134_07326 [Microscilla marina ATCC 23134]
MHSNFLHRYDYRRRLNEADLLDFIAGDWGKLAEAQKSAIEEMGEYMAARSSLPKIFIRLFAYDFAQTFAAGDLVWVNMSPDTHLPPEVKYYRVIKANQGITPSSDNSAYWQPLTTDPRSTIVRDFVVDIALYRVVPANSPVEIASQFRQFYDDAIAWCKVYMKNERPTQLPQEPPGDRGILIAGGKDKAKYGGSSNNDRRNSYQGW